VSTSSRWLLIAALLVGPALLDAAAADLTPSADWLARTWQTDEGLPDNNVTGIEQTADGYLWVATLGGLMRFDGARFEEFSTMHLPRVVNRNVRKLYLDRRGQRWLALDRGALIRVGATTARVFDAEDGFPGSRVVVVVEDSEDGVWFVAGNEVGRIRGDKVDLFGAAEGLPAGASPWLARDGRGQLWFVRGSQVGVFRDGRWQTLLTLDSSPVRCVAARSGGLWLCTASQVLKFTEGSEPLLLARLPERVMVRAMLEAHRCFMDWHGGGWAAAVARARTRVRDGFAS
jgi:ligand-binding sensor domain-containing protein